MTNEADETPKGTDAAGRLDGLVMRGKNKFVSLLLRGLGYVPGSVVETTGRRKYVIDIHGARRRLHRDA